MLHLAIYSIQIYFLIGFIQQLTDIDLQIQYYFNPIQIFIILSSIIQIQINQIIQHLVMQMHYDSRQLNIIKRRIRDAPPERAGHYKSNAKDVFHPLRMDQTSYSSEQEITIPFVRKPQNLREYIKQMKVRTYTMIFIQKLKRNRLNVDIPDNYCEPYIKYHSYTTNGKINGFQINTKFKLLLDILTVFSIIFIQLFATFQMFFDDFRMYYQTYLWYYILKCIVFCCIIMRMICGFVVKVEIYGMKIERVDEIIKFYLNSSNFWLDLALLVSIVLMIIHPTLAYPGIIAYFGTLANFIFFNRVEVFITFNLFNNNTQKQYFDLLKLFLANCFFSHITATFLIAITCINTGERNWMNKYGISEQTWFIKYIYAVYWAASTVFTIGFGDISVANHHQAVLVLFIVMIGCLTLAYNISQVGQIISQLTRINDQVQNQLATLQRVAQSTHISNSLHHSMSQYIIYAAQIKKSFEVNQTRNLINMLPQQMRDNFLEQSSSNFFQDVPYFSYLSSKTKIKLSQKMVLQIGAPGQYLTHERYRFQNIYFVRKGKLGLAYLKKGAKLKGTVLEIINIESEQDPPELLNKYLLIRGRKLNYDIICQGYTTISILTYDQLHECLKEHEYDLEFFSQLRDSFNIGEEEWNRTPCQNCQSNHSMFVCPRLHYMPFRNFIFLKCQKNEHKNKNLRSPFQYVRQFSRFSKLYTLKLWKTIFKQIESVLSIDSKKKITLSIKRISSYSSVDTQYHKWNLKVDSNFNQKIAESDFEVDQIHNFGNYFVHCNPKVIAQTPLDRLKEFLIFQKKNSTCIVD